MQQILKIIKLELLGEVSIIQYAIIRRKILCNINIINKNDIIYAKEMTMKRD